MHYLPLASGGVLLFTMVFFNRIQLDSLLILFAVLPLTAGYAYLNTERSGVIPPLTVNSFEWPDVVMPVLRQLQIATKHRQSICTPGYKARKDGRSRRHLLDRWVHHRTPEDVQIRELSHAERGHLLSRLRSPRTR